MKRIWGTGRSKWAAAGTALMAVAVLAGCNGPDGGANSPLTPSTTKSPTAQGVAATNDGSLVQYSPSQVSGNLAAGGLTATYQLVKANKGAKLTAGAFTLTIPAGALAQDTNVSLSEADPYTMQCQCEPTGLTFTVPATLTFDYRGTSADPSSPSYTGTGTVSADWLDPSTSTWTGIGGSNNSSRKQLTVSLNHFSYYALAQ